MKTDSVKLSLVDVSLVDGLGNTMPLFYHEGQYYVEARDLAEYRIEVKGHASGKLEVLTSVDGMNTLKKEKAHFQLSRGMVISGRTLYDVKGWRIDDDHTRPFVFTVLSAEAIATQVTKRTDNLGVIAVAVYREYVEPPQVYMNFRGGSVSKGSLESSRSFPGMGTGMGDRLDSDHVGHTTFQRASYDPTEMVEIFAMPGWWLKQQGIIRDVSTSRPHGFAGGTGYDNLNKI